MKIYPINLWWTIPSQRKFWAFEITQPKQNKFLLSVILKQEFSYLSLFRRTKKNCFKPRQPSTRLCVTFRATIGRLLKYSRVSCIFRLEMKTSISFMIIYLRFYLFFLFTFAYLFYSRLSIPPPKFFVTFARLAFRK